MHRAVVDPARHVVLRGHGVDVAREDDRRRGVADEQHLAVVVERLARDERADELHDRGFLPALGEHVDELKRPGCEVCARHRPILTHDKGPAVRGLLSMTTLQGPSWACW